MKLKTFYETALKKGIKEDLRPKKEVELVLKKSKKDFTAAKGIDKKTFDTASLTNPYSDTRILNGTGEEEIKSVMVGIDIDVAELLLADRLREKGKRIDLVVSHHPSGEAFARLHKVMGLQPVVWEKYGMDKDVASHIMKDRIEEVFRGISSSNHTRAVDAAKLLGIPFVCMHTIADNCVANFLQKLFDEKKPKKLKNIMSILKAIPEYRYSMEAGAGPYISIGEEESISGKVFVDMTGGTSGPSRIYPRLSQSGVKTVVGMHCKEASRKIVKAEFMNYVIAGHISSDVLGMNLLFDAIEKKGELDFVECSGFKRVRRKNA